MDWSGTGLKRARLGKELKALAGKCVRMFKAVAKPLAASVVAQSAAWIASVFIAYLAYSHEIAAGSTPAWFLGGIGIAAGALNLAFFAWAGRSSKGAAKGLFAGATVGIAAALWGACLNFLFMALGGVKLTAFAAAEMQSYALKFALLPSLTAEAAVIWTLASLGLGLVFGALFGLLGGAAK